MTEGNYLVYTLLFLYRRLAIAACVIYFDTSVTTQFVTVTMTGLATVMLLALKQPFSSKLRNTVEILEECGIMIINYHVFCFTDFVTGGEIQHKVGYSLITCVALHLTLFLGGILISSIRSNIRKLSMYCYKREAKKMAKKHRPGKKFRERRLVLEMEKIIDDNE